VRALNLANSDKRKVESKHFARMPNLHFLVLDGCDLSGNLECISKELRWLQWRDMPLAHFPHCLNLSNLTSLDFSRSSKLVETWVESNLALEVCSLDPFSCWSRTTGLLGAWMAMIGT
jgi:hypothetical protein